MKQMSKRTIALGFFDGVHIGHAKLIETSKLRSNENKTIPAVLTFDVHPSSVLSGTKSKLINSSEDRKYIIKRYFGVDDIIILHFNRQTADMSWQDFFHKLLLKKYEASHLIAGWDYRFGRNAEGNVALLSEECQKTGIGLDVIPAVTLNNQTVKSTYIRQLIAEGMTELAEIFLGHPHILSGIVEHGKGLGHTIGIPTANIKIPDEVQEPKNGVYAAKVLIDGKTYLSVTNVGKNPTVDTDGKVKVESFIQDFCGDLYGHKIILEFGKRLRSEKKFPSLSALREQIAFDAAAAKEYYRYRDMSAQNNEK